MVILLIDIGNYSISVKLMVIILMDIGFILLLSINGYWWLNYHNLLVAILLIVIILMAIGGYFKLYYNY